MAVLDAAPKQYVDAVMPVGIIMMFGGAAAPPGGKWALCNGAELETTAYPDLYAIVGTSYVVGTPAAGRFNLPNLVNRMPLGAGTAAVGTTGGSANSVVPTHSHTIDHTHPASTSGTDSPDHTHLGVDHLHTVNIQSGNQSANHYHGGPGGGINLLSETDAGSGYYTGGGDSIAALWRAGTHWEVGAHSHTVSGWTSAADRGLTTGGASARHTHSTTTSAMAGRSGTEGVAVTNANLPPYVVVQYIIRVL